MLMHILISFNNWNSRNSSKHYRTIGTKVQDTSSFLMMQRRDVIRLHVVRLSSVSWYRYNNNTDDLTNRSRNGRQQHHSRHRFSAFQSNTNRSFSSLRSLQPSHNSLRQQHLILTRQQVRFWQDVAPNPEYVAMEERRKLDELLYTPDEVDIRLAEIAADTTSDTQQIWIQFFFDGKLVNGTQISIPKYNPNIDMIKYATYDKCYHMLASHDIAPLTLQVLPTRHKRRKSTKKKLTRQNRLLAADTIYNMRLHGGESEIAGVIVKAHTRRYSPEIYGDRHYTYGEKVAIDLGMDYIRAIVQDYTMIPIATTTKKDTTAATSDTSSTSSPTSNVQVLHAVPNLETGGQFVTNIVLRPNITEAFWNQVYNITEYGSVQPPSAPPSGQQKSIKQPAPIDEKNVNNSRYDEENNSITIDDEPAIDRYRVYVTGTQGVGLTTTTPILIRQLLQQGKTVVYHIPHTSWIYEFKPHNQIVTNVMDTVKDVNIGSSSNSTDGSSNESSFMYKNVDVKAFAEKEFQMSKSTTLVGNYSNSYYIVDYGSCDTNTLPIQLPSPTTKCRIIIIAAQNTIDTILTKSLYCLGGHMSSTIMYYPLWTLSELFLYSQCLACIPSSSHPMRSDERAIRQRYHHVGGVPGCIFTLPYTYRNILQAQYNTIANLTDAQLLPIMRNHWTSLLTYSNQQFPLVGYVSSNPHGSLKTITSSRNSVLSTDDKGGDVSAFLVPTVGPISKNVMESIYFYHKDYFMNQLQSMQQQQPTSNVYDDFGNKFLKVLFRNLMMENHQKMLYTSTYKDLYSSGGESIDNCSTASKSPKIISLGEYDDVVELSEGYNDVQLLSHAKDKENVLFCASTMLQQQRTNERHMEQKNLSTHTNNNSNPNRIDFVYRRGNVYHIFHLTTKLHVKEEHCTDMLNDIIRHLGSIKSKKIQQGQQPQSIQFFFVIPTYNFNTFTIIPQQEQSSSLPGSVVAEMTKEQHRIHALNFDPNVANIDNMNLYKELDK